MYALAWLFFLVLVGLVVKALSDVKNLTRRLDKLEDLVSGKMEASELWVELPETSPQPLETEPLAATPTASPPDTGEYLPPRKEDQTSLEMLIAGKWLNRIGVVAFLFATGYFLKYAFDNRWIGETGRVILGFVAGVIFLALGARYQAKAYQRFSQGLTGGGIALFYLSLYAAFAFYKLIPQTPAFMFMIVVTVASIVLAIRYNALPIAMLASTGGFLTPVLLSTGVDNQVVLFTYILLLNLGILGIAYFRKWPLLNCQNFILTVITFVTWSGRFYTPQKLWTTVLFLTLFFIVFASFPVLHNIVNRRKASQAELILAFFNAGLYFGIMYWLLEDKYDDYLGLFSLAMGATYVALSYFTHRRNKEDRFLVWLFLGLAGTFVSLAVPVQLKQNWITIAWAIEGTILTYLGFRFKSGNILSASVVVLGLAFLRLIYSDVSLPSELPIEEFSLLLNKRALAFVFGIAALFCSGHFFAKTPKDVFTESSFTAGCLVIAANFLTVVFLSIETKDYFRFLLSQGRISPATLSYAQQLSLSVIWTLYATLLVVVGIWKGYKSSRYMGLLLFGITILKVFFVDLSELARFYRIISFLVLGIILIGVSFLYQRYRGILIGPTEAEGKGKSSLSP
jgi:uncharacterized membrane protein